MKFYNGKILLPLTFFIAFFIGLVSFQKNMLGSVDNDFFAGLDRFSQILVTGRIIAHDAHVDDQGWNLGSVTINGVLEYSDNNLNTFNELVKKNEVSSVIYFPYQSHYGIQGAFFLWLHDTFNIDDVDGLQFVNSIFFSLVIAALSVLFIRVYDWKFALVFFFVMVTSPWVVSFARNMYWVPFLWFLPAVLSSMLYLAKRPLIKGLLLVGVFFSVFIKSLAGYEYLSTITIFACSVFIVGPFFRTESVNYAYNVRMAALVFATCVVGFLCALVIHAEMRGDSVASGLMNILEQDVKKRTYGDPAAFDPILRESLTASVVDVIRKYWFDWKTPLFFGIPAYLLSFATIFFLVGFCYSFFRKKGFDLKPMVLIVFFLLCPMSWYVLAKGHSFVHTQLNYVLWYFGFMQALVYGVIVYLLIIGADAYRFLRGLGVKGMVIAALLPCLLVLVGMFLSARELDKEQDRIFESSVDSFDVGADFTVILSKSKELIFFKKDCAAADLNNTFFVHAYPEKSESHTGMNSGFLNLDFKMPSSSKGKKWLSKYYGSCTAVVELPPYSLGKLDVGQYTLPDVVIIWKESLSLAGKYYSGSVTPFNLTDGNWLDGIFRFNAAFFVENNFVNRQSLKVGDNLLLGGSGKREILRIDYSAEYISVFLDGEPLNPALDGYPNKVLIYKY
ncbi:hypothetical protein JFT44_08120 [Pseudomonas sp. MF5691]|uniref:hypothetical protein n=1 Tax=Pseudomonas sp. MF5691 TaxID=2797526 RepID=UPI0018E89245|nr:hypothetical protein [Pseudomonas sp. MF5691]MBJ2289909.1 hypothetical protein [Pseudomonas sp. MF5691]